MQKLGVPFRSIVSKGGTWQLAKSGFLQKHLDALIMHDPFSISNSGEVVSFLSTVEFSACTAVSIDVEDLFYSLRRDLLMQRVKECTIEDNDEVEFRNASGTMMEAFLKLLSFYLCNTIVGFKNKVFVQKSGVCIRR